MERRFTHNKPVKLVTRGEGDEKTQVIEGTGVVFYDGTPETEYKLWSDTFERIDSGALDRAIKESQDVRGLFNHIPSNLLGRTKSGTMRLKKTKTGVDYSIDKADTTISNDVATHLERGDVSGSSFAMIPTRVEWFEEDREGRTVDVRIIKDVDLFDMGPVTYPAYEGTTAGVRDESDVSEARSEYDAWIESKKIGDDSGYDLTKMRARRLTLLKNK